VFSVGHDYNGASVIWSSAVNYYLFIHSY